MKEISPTGREFQTATLEQWICNPRITLMPLYLSFALLPYLYIHLFADSLETRN
jgi:hypothetical protein